MNIRSMIRRIGFTLGRHVYFVIIPTIVIDYDPYLQILAIELWLPFIDLGIYFDSKNTEKILKRLEKEETNEKINNKKVSR